MTYRELRAKLDQLSEADLDRTAMVWESGMPDEPVYLIDLQVCRGNENHHLSAGDVCLVV